MSGRHQRLDFVGVNLDHLQPLLGHRQLGDAEIRLVVEHGLHHARAVGAVHQDLHVGKLLLELGKHQRQDVDAGGFVGRDEQFPARHAFQLIDQVLGAAPQRQDLLGIIGENVPGRA